MKKLASGIGGTVAFLFSAAVIVWELYATLVVWHGGVLWPTHFHVGPDGLLALLMLLVGWEIAGGVAWFAVTVVVMVLAGIVGLLALPFTRKAKA